MICIPPHLGYYRRLCLYSLTQVLTVLETKYLLKTFHISKNKTVLFFKKSTHVFERCPCNSELYLERCDIGAVTKNNTYNLLRRDVVWSDKIL